MKDLIIDDFYADVVKLAEEAKKKETESEKDKEKDENRSRK